MDYIGRFCRQYQKKCYVARVHFRIDKAVGRSTVTAQLEQPAEKNWVQGAVIGAEFALSKIRNAAYTVTITRIDGSDTETNASVAAAAITLGIWEAARFDPGSLLLEFIQHKALTSWKLPVDALPSLEEREAVHAN